MMTDITESGGTSLRFPAVSPDDKIVAYEREAKDDGIWTIGIDGKNMRRLTQSVSG